MPMGFHQGFDAQWPIHLEHPFAIRPHLDDSKNIGPNLYPNPDPGALSGLCNSEELPLSKDICEKNLYLPSGITSDPLKSCLDDLGLVQH